MSRGEIRRRSLAGVFFVTFSGVVNLGLGFLGTLVVARILTPDDFGVVAVGATITTLGYVVAEGGLGAGLVRRPEPPTVSELRTLNGIQLTLAVAICVPVAAIALNFGLVGAVTAVMVLSLPITTLQAPGRLMLARSLKFDRQSAIDVGMQASFQGFTVVAVLLGAGVWGIAAGTVVRAFVGTYLTAALSIGLVAPWLRDWRSFRDVQRFGVRFQATWLALTGRDQAINMVTGAVGGVAVLGLWSFTNRLIQWPLLAFGSLWAVSFPAMSSLIAGGEDVGPLILSAVRRAAIGGALMFAPFVAATPALVVVVFGEQWAGTVDAIALVTLGSFVLGSVSVSTAGYLAAIGRPGAVFRATVAFGLVWVALAVALLPKYGVTGVGVGNLCGALVETFLLAHWTRRIAGVEPLWPLCRPLVAAGCAAMTGWTLCRLAEPSLLVGLGAAALTLILAVAGLWLACRADLIATLRLVADAVRSALPWVRRLPQTTDG